MDRIGRNEIGHYLEFGVYNGTSLLCMYRALKETGLEDVRLIGFDSFEGLPPDLEGTWRAGDFKSTFEFTQAVLSLNGIDWSRVALVKGWFKDTLNAETARHHRIDKVGVVMIDCDLYAAAREALDFCRHLVKDQAIIVFDDWHSGGLDEKGMGEKRAFDEFLGANPQFSSSHLENLSGYGERAAVFLLTRSGSVTLR